MYFGNADLGLKFERYESVGRHLARYVDSDYVGDLDNLCSTTKLEVDLQWVGGQYCSQIFHCQPLKLNTWLSFKAIKEFIWPQNLIVDFGNHQEHDLEIQHN